MRFAVLICLIAAPVFAGTWSGVLVNSRCYEDVERNVSPTNSAIDVYRDRNGEIRYCRANAKTKEFTIVQSDGQSFRLDAAGDAKAAEIVRNGNPKWIFVVTVSGELMDQNIAVDSMSMLRNVRP